MANSSKWDKFREWVKAVMPLIVLGVGWCLSYLVIETANEKAKSRQLDILAKEQQRSNDIAISQTIFEILSQERSNLYPWLSGLVSTIKDTSLQKVIDSAVQANPIIPDDIRANVKDIVTVILENQNNNETVIEDKVKDEAGMYQGEYRIQIIYMLNDDLSQSRCQSIYDYLIKKQFKCEKEYRSYDWYIGYFSHTRPEDLKGTAEINYYVLNDQEEAIADCIYKKLSKNSELGNFKLRTNQQRVFPLGVIGIVIPSIIKNPYED